MKTLSLEDVPFRLTLVALWAVTWGGAAVYNAVVRLNEASPEFLEFLLAANAAVIGVALLTLAVLLFTSAPVVRKLAVGAFVVLGVSEALRATPDDVVALGTVALHLTAALVLVYTRRYFETERVEAPDEGATRFGV
jgi:hypothetical protein